MYVYDSHTNTHVKFSGCVCTGSPSHHHVLVITEALDASWRDHYNSAIISMVTPPPSLSMVVVPSLVWLFVSIETRYYWPIVAFYFVKNLVSNKGDFLASCWSWRVYFLVEMCFNVKIEQNWMSQSCCSLYSCLPRLDSPIYLVKRPQLNCSRGSGVIDLNIFL